MRRTRLEVGCWCGTWVVSFPGVLKLLLPALFPSWRFFDVIGPSPRVEICLLEHPGDDRTGWRALRSRPLRLGVFDRLRAFFWNARWNETLHLANCAERFVQGQTEHCTREIRRRVRSDLRAAGDGAVPAPFFCFRLVFVSRHEGMIRRDVAFVSPPFETFDPLDS
jgi:hypothetical protein